MSNDHMTVSRKDITEIADELAADTIALAAEATWAIGEIKRLRAENTELRLKVDNLLYMLRKVTAGNVTQ